MKVNKNSNILWNGRKMEEIEEPLCSNNEFIAFHNEFSIQFCKIQKSRSDVPGCD